MGKLYNKVYDVINAPFIVADKFKEDVNYFYEIKWKRTAISSLIMTMIHLLSIENINWSMKFVYNDIAKVFFMIFGAFIFIDFIIKDLMNNKKKKALANNSN